MTDNLRIWNAVGKTNPAYTKKVNQRGGFTAISAQYQILAATEQFGPIGIGWGYTTGSPIITDTLMTVPVTLWHGSRDNAFGPMLGCEEWKDKNGRVDSDAPKKAVTDGLTKLLSQLGFNADVFLGKFDDVKYVEKVTKEFAAADKAAQAADAPEWPSIDSFADETQRNLYVTMRACTSLNEIKQWGKINAELIGEQSEQFRDTLRAEYSARTVGHEQVARLAA